METEEEVRREQSWYIRDLMAYMLGIPGEDLERLVESYQEDGGAPDPGGGFSATFPPGERSTRFSGRRSPSAMPSACSSLR